MSTFRCAELSLESSGAARRHRAGRRAVELVEREKPWGRDHGLVSEGAKVLLGAES